MPSISHSGLNSYLMGRAITTYQYIINNWLSEDCLFDSYLIKARFSSIGHSIRHFVLYGYSVLTKHLCRTAKVSNTIESYLTAKLIGGINSDIKRCKSDTCLFDCYLIETIYRSSKTPKPLCESGSFSPLPLGQRDITKILNTAFI